MRLNRVLGLGFGVAFAFGTMVGVGILRLPGMVAAAAATPGRILACWVLGGLYALMGAVSMSELAVMYPEAGGLRVYVRRALGEGVGFVVGWSDWLACVATLAYASVSVVDFLGLLWPALAAPPLPTALALAVLAAFTLLHWGGLKMGSTVTTLASSLTAVLLLVLVAACFFGGTRVVAGPATAAPAGAAPAAALSLLVLMPALRAIVTAYDGWYAPIYTAEESRDAARTLPRAIIGGAALVMALYLAINAALLHVLPVPVLAASRLPVADAAQLVLPRGSAALLTTLSLVIVLGLINGNALMAPRVLFGLARDGWIPAGIAGVSPRGTPRAALLVSMVLSAVMILSGSFNQLIALFALLIVLGYVAVFTSVFVLRLREPAAPRPYRAFGYPFSTFIVLLGSVAFLVAAVLEDPHSGALALLFMSLCLPAYLLAARARRARRAAATA